MASESQIPITHDTQKCAYLRKIRNESHTRTNKKYYSSQFSTDMRARSLNDESKNYNLTIVKQKNYIRMAASKAGAILLASRI